nr:MULTISPECIES: LacI family DNA-binding transcriptional regulator [unclassified Devosia]
MSSTGRRVTMTDIARAAGCSQATVSFVLNNTAGMKLSAETRQRVFETASALGYAIPEAATAPIAAEMPNRIGIIVDQIATSPEAVQAIDGLSAAIQERGGLVYVGQSRGDSDVEARLIDDFLQQGISALVYLTIFTREVTPTTALRNAPVPVYLLNCYTANQATPSAVPSEIAGGQRSTHHLITQGHRRIATITGEIWMEAAQDRLKGYRRALATADIPFEQYLVFEGDWSTSAGYEATRKILALPDRPTAVFCQNDRMAVGCYQALKEAGLSIPQDMSVVGYDDEEIARHLHPQLTTSVLPHRAMGQWAAEQILGGTEARASGMTKVECPLIIRASVAPPRP